ncbi:hypothetical protein HanIR_Chr15g0734371 [Helianthus annuus]|nr:hypothetical protein HanIR_Chr15g0734371 [Helianthus annuus]
MISPSIVDVQMEGSKILNAKFHIVDNMCDVGNSDFVKVDDRVLKNGASIRVPPIGTCGLNTNVNNDSGSVDPSLRINNRDHDLIGHFNSILVDGKKTMEVGLTLNQA